MKSSVINIVKTPQGYSIIQAENLINKPHFIKPTKEKNALTPKKFTQQTFTIYPYIDAQKTSYSNQKYLIIPARTQWFNLNLVHDIEKKALPQWFKVRKGVLATMNHIKFQKNQEIYKKYRNHIIQLGKIQYLTPLMARKGLAGDASAIIRIHNFLAKWGLINFVHSKKTINQSHNEAQQAFQDSSSCQGEISTSISKRKDCFDKDKVLITKNYNKDDLQLLRKITRKVRPVCGCCQGICGIAWYQYKQKMSFKSFKLISENQNDKGNKVQSGNTFDYELRLCYSCFNLKSMPVILTNDDFTKFTILDVIKILPQKNVRNKSSEYIKISEAMQRNKFNLKKCSQFLKLSQQSLLSALMQMPIQALQKISRIEPQTDDEISIKDPSKKTTCEQEKNCQIENFSIVDKKEQKVGQNIEEQEDEKNFMKNILSLQREQKQVYEEFIQSWLLKMYVKLQELQEWDKTTIWSLESSLQHQKSSLVRTLARKKRQVNQQIVKEVQEPIAEEIKE